MDELMEIIFQELANLHDIELTIPEFLSMCWEWIVRYLLFGWIWM